MTWIVSWPVTDTIIINASPLESFADEVWVPEPVAEEILQRGKKDITAQAINKTAWLVTKPVQHIPLAIMEWRLGAGESAVLALGLTHSSTVVIIDDLAGRKCAASLDIGVRGTLGLVLAAKRRGVIPAARPVSEDMMAAGLYLSKRVLEQALERVGE